MRCALAFGFNAWGGKYPPWDLDDRVGAAIAELAGVACEELAFVLEGGSIDGDGAGTIADHRVVPAESRIARRRRARARRWRSASRAGSARAA